MKNPISRVTVSSMTDRRIDSAVFTRRAVKNALSSVRRLCGRIHLEIRRGEDKTDRQNRLNEMGGGRLTTRRMQLDEEEIRNLRNENLENEFRELATKIVH